MAYSKDFREQVLVHCINGMTDDQVSAKMGVSKPTIGNWKKLLFSTGSLDKKKVTRKSGKPYKYTPEKIGELLGKGYSTEIVGASSGSGVQDSPKVHNPLSFKKDKKDKNKKKSK